MYGETSAQAFGPRCLRRLRDAMVAGDPKADPPRPGWARTTVNARIHAVAAIFKWAASHELLPVTVYQALKTVEALRRGQTAAHETVPTTPAPQTAIEAARAHLVAPLQAMIDLQLLAGMRPGELCALRTCDLDRSGKVWRYAPDGHKTAT